MPQPIDPSTELARLTAAQRVQDLADRAQLAAQHRQSQAVQESQVHAETSVQQSDRSEEQDGIPDQKGEKQERKRRHAHPPGTVDTESEQRRKAGDLQVIPEVEDQHRLDVTI